MGEDTLSFEQLFDLLRQEREQGELVALREDFYVDVVAYLKSKQKLLDTAGNDVFSPEVDSLKKQLFSLRRVLKEIYDRREQKILHLASNAAKTSSDFVDLAALTPEEKECYKESFSLLKKYRRQLLLDIFSMKAPALSAQIEAKKVKDEAFDKRVDEITDRFDDKASIKVKFLRDVPKFLGKDSSAFGPFTQGDEKELPQNIAQILIKKGHAEIQ
jgi:DNA replication initiation complex subunit (GINS family)